MDAWGRQQLQPWLETRLELPIGPLFCIVAGTTCGQHRANAAARADLRRTAARTGRFARTSCATPTPSRWHTKASRWW